MAGSETPWHAPTERRAKRQKQSVATSSEKRASWDLEGSRIWGSRIWPYREASVLTNQAYRRPRFSGLPEAEPLKSASGNLVADGPHSIADVSPFAFARSVSAHR